MAQSLATITLKVFLPNRKSEACKNCKRALLQSPLIFSLISHVCNCTWTGEGLSLSIRIIQKGILEAILFLCIKSSKIKEGSNFCLLLSNSRTCYPSYQYFFQWGLYCDVLLLFLCNFTKLGAACDKVQENLLPWAAKNLTCNNCTGEVLQFLTGGKSVTLWVKTEIEL